MGKKKPGKAVGIYTSTLGGADRLPDTINANKVIGYSRNIHLSSRYLTLKMQVFPGAPQIWVEDIDGVMDEKLTTEFKQFYENANLYESMQQSFFECVFFGCSVKSLGYESIDGKYCLTEIRDLPAQSFNSSVSGGIGDNQIINPLMPGITVNKEGEITAYQTDANGLQTKLENFEIIREPTSPYPSGSAYILPCYPIVAVMSKAIKAIDQQVHRIGAPIVFPQMTDQVVLDDEAISRWSRDFLKRWGKDIGFMIPQGINFPDMKIHENDVAQKWLEHLESVLNVFFNPTLILQQGNGTTIGASDSGALEIWNNYIGGTQSWLERAYENMLQPLLETNGYEGQYVRIRLKRPEINRSESRREQVALAFQAHAITTEEIRDNLKDLELKEWNDNVKEELNETYSRVSQNESDVNSDSQGFGSSGIFARLNMNDVNNLEKRVINNLTSADKKKDAELEQYMVDVDTAILEELLRVMKNT